MRFLPFSEGVWERESAGVGKVGEQERREEKRERKRERDVIRDGFIPRRSEFCRRRNVYN